MDVSRPSGSSAPNPSTTPASPREDTPLSERTPASASAHDSGLPPRRSSESFSMSPLRRALPSPLLEAVHGGDLATLRTLYERDAAGRSPLAVWRDAADHQRHDLQHAVLVLHGVERELSATPRPEFAETTPMFPNGELHRPLTSGAHPSLVDHIKRFPYYSEKSDRTTFENLNTKVKFQDRDDLIVCRHLALGWAFDLDAAGKPDYPGLRDADSIRRRVSFQTNELFEHLEAAVADSHVVALKDWGAFVSGQLRALKGSGGDAAKRMVVSSDSHAMAMELKVKREPDGVRYVANFYDPNRTSVHKRTAGNELHSFESLRLEDMLVNVAKLGLYFGQGTALFAIGVPPGGPAAMPRPQPGGDPERRVASPLPPLDDSVMHFLLAGGFAGTLRDIQPAVAELAKENPGEAARLLIGEGKTTAETPGLHFALQNGHSHVIPAVLELAQAVPLTPQALFILLAARGSDGTPGVSVAMEAGLAPTVRTFIVGVAASGLPMSDQLELLAARKSKFAPPALGLAVEKGKLETVRAYLDGIDAHPALGENDKVRLLSIGSDQGMQALAHGLVKGNREALSILLEWIIKGDFSAANQRRLLRAENDQAMPALAEAILKGATRNVQILTEAVLASPLSNADKVEVLQMGRWRGDLWGSRALEAYQGAVRASSLPPSAQELLLADVSGDRRSRRF